ncbi:MAG: RHS repeat-associated core domain-containing protein, partial [Paludibacteraceae bacterium]|nr:RHS repeat-associated core domain-containing protein [Paludibacteraceae bacterium]
MAVITDEPAATETPAVESLTDYYPFGMTMPSRSYNAHTYRHGFTGHEKESDLAEGIYTTEYRLYDARVGRWLSVDPLFEKYVGMSPYNYCMLNPVMMVDPDGRSLAVLQAPEGAAGAGHLAILIQNEDRKWALYSKNGTNERGGIKGENVTEDNFVEGGKRPIDKGQHTFDTVEEFLNSTENPIDEDGERQYTEAFVIECGPEIDREAEIGAKSVLDEDYDVLDSNCAQVVQAALKRADFNDGSEEKHSIDFEKGPIKIHKEFSTPNLRPNKIYESIKENNNGKVIKVDD